MHCPSGDDIMTERDEEDCAGRLDNGRVVVAVEHTYTVPSATYTAGHSVSQAATGATGYVKTGGTAVTVIVVAQTSSTNMFDGSAITVNSGTAFTPTAWSAAGTRPKLHPEVTFTLASATYTAGHAVLQAGTNAKGRVKATVTGTSVVVLTDAGTFDGTAITINGGAGVTPSAHSLGPTTQNAGGSPGNKCHHDCSGRGLCDHSVGLCTCFAGWIGENCGTQNALAGA